MDKEPKVTKVSPGYAIGYVPNEPWISDVENTNILDDDTEEVEDTVDLTTLTYVEKKAEVKKKRRKWNKKGD